MKYQRILWLIVIIVFLVTGCNAKPTTSMTEDPNSLGSIGANTPTSPPSPPKKETITITTTGDILMHNTQIWSGQQKDGTYRFDFFGLVKNLLEEGDYCSTNFEAAMAGPETGYTGYPLFNSPDAMAISLKEAGFDLIIGANNHILDRGYKGALRTLKVLQEAGLETIGANRSFEEQQRLFIKDIRGVKIGYLAYTYGTNGITVPKDHSYLINYLNKDKVLLDIAKIRNQVDALVLILHWGVEYTAKPTDEQKKLAHEFLSAGADVILGSHPHVIQTMENFKVNGKDKFVIYSMGNFLGDQRGLERNSGVVLKLRLTKDFGSGETALQEVSYVPTYSHSYYENGRQKFRVIPIELTINNIKNKQEKILKESDIPTLEQVLKDTRNRLGVEWKAEKLN